MAKDLCPEPPPMPPSNKGLPLKYPNISLSKDKTLCKWANCDELQAACIRHGICLHLKPYKIKYCHLTSVRQDGPCCGLVALSILSNGKLDPHTLLADAKKLGFTNNGEMFSAEFMMELCRQQDLLSNFKIVIKNGPIYKEATVNELLNGSLILVPYDSDFNHSPCMKNGHKAHWAIITGIIIPNEVENILEKPENIFVFAKHGKSSNLAIWSLKELSESNGNLYEFSPKRADDNLSYILPEGGIGGEKGLKNKFLLVKRAC